MAIDRSLIGTNDSGGGTDGTAVTTTYIGAAIYDKIDLLVGEATTWTPTIGGSGGQTGQVYALNTARYIKVNKLVTVWGGIHLSTLGTITSQVQIQGFPFNFATDLSSLYISFFAAMNTSYSFLTAFGNLSTGTATIYSVAAGGAAGMLTIAQANLTAASQIWFAGSYESV